MSSSSKRCSGCIRSGRQCLRELISDIEWDEIEQLENENLISPFRKGLTLNHGSPNFNHSWPLLNRNLQSSILSLCNWANKRDCWRIVDLDYWFMILRFWPSRILKIRLILLLRNLMLRGTSSNLWIPLPWSSLINRSDIKNLLLRLKLPHQLRAIQVLNRFPWAFFRISSTSHSSSGKASVQLAFLFVGSNNDTWNTGCIFHPGGSFNL